LETEREGGEALERVARQTRGGGKHKHGVRVRFRERRKSGNMGYGDFVVAKEKCLCQAGKQFDGIGTVDGTHQSQVGERFRTGKFLRAKETINAFVIAIEDIGP